MIMNTTPEPIAITGLGLRFPKANNPQEFWRLMREGQNGIGLVPPGRWSEKDYYDPKPGKRGKIITNQGGFLDDITQFDWRAFRISPREASRIDPQQRLLLEVTWEAFEDAGLTFTALAGSKTGVFIGLTWNDFLRSQSQAVENMDGYTATGNLFSFASNRISHFFDLGGPSMSLDGACASSLMATQLACESLWSKQTNLAVIGGVELMLTADSSVIMSQAGILSASGQCRTLDENADGFIRGEGAGVMVLQRLSDVKVADSIYALICGTAVNHNGRNNWIMAPRGQAQKRVIREAYQRAGKKLGQVDYIELHGTAFQEGDVVETLALGQVVGQARGRKQPCLVGSNKPNIGSLGAAAGIASLIKVALALHYEEIPPVINLEQVNPHIPLKELNLSPPRKLTPWPKTKGRLPLAGVNGTSLSGSNAHVVLEKYMPRGRKQARSKSKQAQATTYPFVLSARSEVALKNIAQAMISFIDTLYTKDSATLPDVCYTLAVHRTHHEYRLAIWGDDFAEVRQLLEAFVAGETVSKLFVGIKTKEKKRKIIYEPEKMGRLFSQGYALNWEALFGEGRRFIRLPAYQWDKDRCWPDWLASASEDKVAKKAPAVKQSKITKSAFLEELQGATEYEKREKLKNTFGQQIIHLLNMPPEETLVWEKSFQELGLDSFLAVELTHFINLMLNSKLSATLLFKYTNLERLVTYLLKEIKSDPTTSLTREPDDDVDTVRNLLDEKIAELEQKLDVV